MGRGVAAAQSNGFTTQNPCRADYNAGMSSAPASHRTAALSGWRAQLWAWVLFVALFRGLIPHAALASAVMDGDPALVWCAPGAGAVQGKAVSSLMGAVHDCVCASAGDGAMPLGHVIQSIHSAAPGLALPSQAPALAAHQVLPPPARGPPLL